MPQWFETDTKKYVDVTSPDNIMIQGRLESGAVVSAYVGVHPYHGSGYRFEIYGKEGTLMMIGGGEAGQEENRKIMGGKKDDKALTGAAGAGAAQMGAGRGAQGRPRLRRRPDVGQVRQGDPHRQRRSSPTSITPCAATGMLDAIVRASETGQRQKVALSGVASASRARRPKRIEHRRSTTRDLQPDSYRSGRGPLRLVAPAGDALRRGSG